MEPLQIEDLYTLEAYATLRPEFRARVMAHKQHRRLLLEYTDPGERQAALERLVGIEDLDRSTDTKTSAVHFLRFELTGAMIAGLRAGRSLSAGVSHSHYPVAVEVSLPMCASLIADLD